MRIFIAHDEANARWVMLQFFHHVSSDAATAEIVQQEIQAHLLGQAAQLPASLPYRNFVAQARLGVSRDEHKAFFHKMLGDVDEPTTPFGLTDVRGDGSNIAEARQPVDGSVARRLRAQARMLRVSAASIFHLAWAQVLARVSGRDDVVFGTVLSGRMLGGSGAARGLGLFINTLPYPVVKKPVWRAAMVFVPRSSRAGLPVSGLKAGPAWLTGLCTPCPRLADSF